MLRDVYLIAFICLNHGGPLVIEEGLWSSRSWRSTGKAGRASKSQSSRLQKARCMQRYVIEAPTDGKNSIKDGRRIVDEDLCLMLLPERGATILRAFTDP